MNSCALFVRGNVKNIYNVPQTEKSQTLYLTLTHSIYFEGKLEKQYEILEDSKEDKKYVEKFMKNFKKRSEFREVKLISRGTVAKTPCLNLNIIHHRLPLMKKIGLYSWMGIFAFSGGIIPVWVKKDLDVEVASNVHGIRHDFKVHRDYTYALSLILLPTMFFNLPITNMPKMQTNLVNEILTKAYSP